MEGWGGDNIERGQEPSASLDLGESETQLIAASYPATTDALSLLGKVRRDVFAVLRRHNASEQCFAEVAMITQAAISAVERDTPIAGE